MAHDTKTLHLNKKITINSLMTQMLMNEKAENYSSRIQDEELNSTMMMMIPMMLLKKDDELPHPSH